MEAPGTVGLPLSGHGSLASVADTRCVPASHDELGPPPLLVPLALHQRTGRARGLLRTRCMHMRARIEQPRGRTQQPQRRAAAPRRRAGLQEQERSALGGQAGRGGGRTMR